MYLSPHDKKEVKRGRGRPKKYATAFELEIAIDRYFLDCDERTYMRGKVMDTTPYTVEGLSHALDIDRRTLLRYEKDANDPEFCRTIKMAKLRIQQDVVERGLTGRSDPVLTIFNLKNNFGYTDKQMHDVKAPIATEQIIGVKITAE